MKQNSRRIQNINKQRQNKNSILSIETDEVDFKQDGRLSDNKLSTSPNKFPRYSENLKKISMAYGMSTNKPSKKSSLFRGVQTGINETQTKRNTTKIDEYSLGQSVNSTQLLESKNLQHYNYSTVGFETVYSNQKFCSIEPRELRVQTKRNASSPPNRIQEEIQALQKQKRKQTTDVQQKLIDKQKLKSLYDKIRNPQNRETTFTFTAESQNSCEELKILNKSPKAAQRHKAIQVVQSQCYQLLKSTEIQSQIQQQSKPIKKSNSIIQLTPRSIKKISTQQLLSGKVSIIWIFAVKCKISENIRNRIIHMYNPLVDEDRAVPLVVNPKRIQDFINIPNCYFKIVTDLQCAEKVIGFRIYTKVIQFHIYNEGGNQTLLKALEFKSVTHKVKGIFTNWQKILNRAEQQIEEQISIYKVNKGLEKRQRQRKFPNFLKLTDTDKTEATLYRINLYGSIKLLPQEKKENYDDFMRLVLSKYGQNQDQQKHIQDYMKIDHLKPTTTLSQAKLIIHFYVRESFYYQVLNSMLRTMKTSQQFKPCILPFNQTYQSIKLYYHNFLKQSSYEIPSMTLYRGCKISKKDFKHLKSGVFIQMFGFMSTSKSQERAKDFVDRDGYLFVINVKKRKVDLERFRNFDHGFVDINRYGLASAEFIKQQQVLFNALNVYQVQKIQQIDDYMYIHLNYGVMFDLLGKSREQLTQDQYETLVNYHYCTKIQGKIQDQGDVFLFANQFVEAKQYYDKKIKQGSNLAHNYFKLANVQKECGEIDEAQKNANQALRLYGQQIDMSDRQKCLKVFGIHTKNAQINFQRQDYLTADEDIDKALSMLSDQEVFQRGVKLRQRGQIKFKKGQIKNAEKDFQESECIFKNIGDQARVRKMTSYKHYYLAHLSLLCSPKTRDDLKMQLKEELSRINQMQVKISQVNDDIEDQLVKINKSLKDVSLYVQDRQKYQIYVKKAQSYLYSLQVRKANDPQLKAKLLAMQAMIADYQQLAQSQKLMYEAIRLIQQKNPFDIKVADYSKILAKMQKAELEKYMIPGKRQINERPQFPIPYDAVKRRQIYERCKLNYTKTLNVLLYHAKNKNSPQIMDVRNQLGQLTFGQNDYEECQKILKQARQGNEKVIHSQMSKTLITMAKISYARGQLKNAFQTLDQAYEVLQKAMVFKHQKQNEQSNKQNKKQKYRNIFQNCDTYIIIKFIRVNIYHKQKKHDIAMKNIEQISSIIVKKVGSDSHPMLADLLQAKGSLQVFQGNIYGFDQFFEKAIQLRQKQFGYYHPMNAKSYCLYAKYLVLVKDQKKAEQMLLKAVEIITAFQQTNPHYWAVYYSQGFFSEQIKQFIQSQAFYNKSLTWAKKYFNKSHIAIKQVMLRYASSLNKSHKMQESLRAYEQLQEQLDQDMRESSKRSQMNQQQDDQKISLKKLMYSQLSSFQSQQQSRNQSYISSTNNNRVDISIYKSKLNLLRNTYNISCSDKIKIQQLNQF